MSQQEITADAVLDACIDRIIRGEEWQSVVHRYPLLAEEVRPLARLTEDLASHVADTPVRVPNRDRIWDQVQARTRPWPLRAATGVALQLREWNREAPALIGMLVTSAMSSVGLLTALAAGVRTIP